MPSINCESLSSVRSMPDVSVDQQPEVNGCKVELAATSNEVLSLSHRSEATSGGGLRAGRDKSECVRALHKLDRIYLEGDGRNCKESQLSDKQKGALQGAVNNGRDVNSKIKQWVKTEGDRTWIRALLRSVLEGEIQERLPYCE